MSTLRSITRTYLATVLADRLDSQNSPDAIVVHVASLIGNTTATPTRSSSTNVGDVEGWEQGAR